MIMHMSANTKVGKEMNFGYKVTLIEDECAAKDLERVIKNKKRSHYEN